MHFQNCLHISTFSKRNRLHFYMKKCCFFFSFLFATTENWGKRFYHLKCLEIIFFNEVLDHSAGWKKCYILALSLENTL